MKLVKSNKRIQAIRIAEARVRMAQRELKALKESEQKAEKIKVEELISQDLFDECVKNVLEAIAAVFDDADPDDPEEPEELLEAGRDAVLDPGYWDSQDLEGDLKMNIGQSDLIQKLDLDRFLSLCRTYDVKVTVNLTGGE